MGFDQSQSELLITIIIIISIIIFVIGSESQDLPSACLCCDSQLLVRDPALCRTHQPEISSHSSTRSFPASLLSSTNHQRRFRLKFILGSSCLFCIPATKLLVRIYISRRCNSARHQDTPASHPSLAQMQATFKKTHMQATFKKAPMKATLQEGPVASHIARRPRRQKELFNEPFTLLLLLHLHPQSFHQFLCLKEQFHIWLIKKVKLPAGCLFPAVCARF